MYLSFFHTVTPAMFAVCPLHVSSKKIKTAVF